MVPRHPHDETVDNALSGSEEQEFEGGEAGPEYHTEDSASEDVDDDMIEEDYAEAPGNARANTNPGVPPYLPLHLLRTAADAGEAAPDTAAIPWEQMTRKQKRRQRKSRIRAKKGQWEELRQVAKGSGVLEAGKFAQAKRGVVPARDKVTRGMVEKRKMKRKPSEPRLSGRQQMLEQRRRLRERNSNVPASIKTTKE